MANPAQQQTISFELVSPERKLIDEPVRMAVMPGVEGEFGVGAGHVSLLAALKPGVVKLYKDNDNAPERRIFIAGGFADVTAEICMALVEEAVDVNDLDRAAIEQELRDLNEDLGIASSETERARVERKIRLAQAKIEAITGQAQV